MSDKPAPIISDAATADPPTTDSPSQSMISQLTSSWPVAKIASVSRLTTLFQGNQKPIVFPPPEWALPDNEVGAQTVQIPSPPPSQPASREPPKENKEQAPLEVSDKDAETSEAKTQSKDGKSTPEEPPEAATLAKRIRSLLPSFPATGKAPNPSDTDPKASDADTKASNPFSDFPTPPDGPLNLNDPNGPPVPKGVGSDLMQWLSSESVMNGSLAKGGQSVWTALEGLRPQKADKKASKPDDSSSSSSSSSDDDSEDEGDNSFMVYAPLQPELGSKVELADSMVGDEQNDGPSRTPSTASKSSKKKSKKKHNKKKNKTIWKPHPTEISLEALWWGYRIYLPPAVLNILDNSSLKAAQRASMITTSLKWILDQIPTLIIPPQYRPAIQVIKSLTPYLGYLGVVITWSWGKIKSLDKGNGVILTATWLLPVALMPDTWKKDDPPTKVITPKAAKGSTKEQAKKVDKAATEEPTKKVEEVPEAAPPPNKRSSSLSTLAKKYFSGSDGKKDGKKKEKDKV